MLHGLHSHAHEDVPFRWFQLLIEVDEITSSELIFDELRMHGKSPNYHEDLWALTSLLVHSHDPDIEDKVLDWINAPQTPEAVIAMLQEFLKEYRRPDPVTSKSGQRNAWSQRAHMLEINTEYIAASRLLDEGETDSARQALETILKADPEYPFAVMLSEMMNANQ